jgi:hypothetical protein
MLSSVADEGRDERNKEVYCTGLSNIFSQRKEHRTHNRLVFWWLQALCFRVIGHYLPCNWVISTVISVLNILVGKVVLNRFLVSDTANPSVT